MAVKVAIRKGGINLDQLDLKGYIEAAMFEWKTLTLSLEDSIYPLYYEHLADGLKTRGLDRIIPVAGSTLSGDISDEETNQIRQLRLQGRLMGKSFQPVVNKLIESEKPSACISSGNPSLIVPFVQIHNGKPHFDSSVGRSAHLYWDDDDSDEPTKHWVMGIAKPYEEGSDYYFNYSDTAVPPKAGWVRDRDRYRGNKYSKRYTIKGTPYTFSVDIQWNYPYDKNQHLLVQGSQAWSQHIEMESDGSDNIEFRSPDFPDFPDL